MPAADAIHLEQLELSAHVGVPDEERAHEQRLTASLTLWPARDFSELDDRIENAVNYAAVAETVTRLVGLRRDRLLETLASEIILELLATFPLRRVRLELRKYILPETAYVAVILTRERSPV